MTQVDAWPCSDQLAVSPELFAERLTDSKLDEETTEIAAHSSATGCRIDGEKEGWWERRLVMSDNSVFSTYISLSEGSK